MTDNQRAAIGCIAAFVVASVMWIAIIRFVWRLLQEHP